MSPTPSLLDPADRATQRDEDAQYYRQVLHELVEVGTRLARAIDRQAAPQPAAAPEQAAQPAPAPTAPPAAAPDLTIAFDRIARTIRRTIALARKLSEPAREAPSPKLRSTECPNDRCPSARQRRTDRAETDALHAEPCERPDQPDFDAPELDADEDLDDDLDEQSLADLIASLRHDTGLATLTDAQLRQHRTPQTAQESAPKGAQEGIPSEMCPFCARAAGPSARAEAGDRAADRTVDPRPPAPPLPTRTSTGPPP